MKRVELVVVGGGPAGLAAAYEAARAGASVLVIDENHRPGGQLFKQIHKFFGSRRHLAGVRGYDIGTQLLGDLKEYGVEVWLNSAVFGLFEGIVLALDRGGEKAIVQAENIILATGASENALSFPGWTLPGVMSAGSAQTLINIYRVLPGKRILMIGSGNVGLIVSYQLMQAGADVVALVEAAPKIGGYSVHAAKIRRAGVPIYTSTTILEATGSDQVSSAVLAAVDGSFRPIPGTERTVEADTVCLAVGLTPLAELAWMAGCEFAFIPRLGGHVPLHDENMMTTCEGIYVAGDITGVEEASTAMEEGRLAGVAAAERLGRIEGPRALQMKEEIRDRMAALRTGPFGEGRRIAKEQLLTAFRASSNSNRYGAGTPGSSGIPISGGPGGVTGGATIG